VIKPLKYAAKIASLEVRPPVAYAAAISPLECPTTAAGLTPQLLRRLTRAIWMAVHSG